jgi:hypothetical protein
MSTAKLTIGYAREGTDDQGTMMVEGSVDFLVKAAAGFSYVIGYLNAAYGADVGHAALAARELAQAHEAAKEGRGFRGDVVNVTIVPDARPS